MFNIRETLEVQLLPLERSCSMATNLTSVKGPLPQRIPLLRPPLYRLIGQTHVPLSKICLFIRSDGSLLSWQCHWAMYTNCVWGYWCTQHCATQIYRLCKWTAWSSSSDRRVVTILHYKGYWISACLRMWPPPSSTTARCEHALGFSVLSCVTVSS